MRNLIINPQQPNKVLRIIISQLGFPISLGNEFYYQHLPLCIIDAVFSIGIRYSIVQKVIQNFCRYTKWNCFRNPIPSPIPPINQQHSIQDLISFYQQNGLNFNWIASNVFKNRCRIPPRKGGITKSEAVYQFAEILHRNKVNYFQDLQKADISSIRNQITNQIPGLRSGIAFDYFLMLAGDCNTVKPDRMVKRYLSWLFCTQVTSNCQAISLLQSLHRLLQPICPNLTLRKLDYAVWSFQRNFIKFGNKNNYITAHQHRRGNLITVQTFTKNQTLFKTYIRQIINHLQRNGWILNGRKITGLVFRACTNGQLKIPDDIIQILEREGITIITILPNIPINLSKRNTLEE
jgi:hypothetical protein